MAVAGCGNIRHSVVKNQISDVTSRTYATALHGIITSSFPGSSPNFVEYCTGNEAKHAVQSSVIVYLHDVRLVHTFTSSYREIEPSTLTSITLSSCHSWLTITCSSKDSATGCIH